MVRTLAGSAASWNGGWARPALAVLRQWTLKAERAVHGRIVRGRSRALAWMGKLGYDLDFECLVHEAAIRLDAWRARQGREIDLAGQSARARRLTEAVQYFGWRRHGAGRYDTPEGILDTGYTGKAAERHAIRQAWTRQLFQRDGRCQHRQTQDALSAGTPCLGAHRRMQFSSFSVSDLRHRCAAGAAPDGRVYQSFWPQCRCRCGVDMPTREHLWWECSHTDRTA